MKVRKITGFIAASAMIFTLAATDSYGGLKDFQTVKAADMNINQKTDDGYEYTIWNSGYQGQVDMVFGETPGTFSCTWSQIYNCIFSMGKKPEESKTVSEYGIVSAEYDADVLFNGNAYFGLYGWLENPTAEYYIVEAWGESRPTAGSSGTLIESDGKKYVIDRIQRINMPSIHGTETYSQYWSVASVNPAVPDTETNISGTVTISNHIDAWEKYAELDQGTLYEVSLQAEAFQSRGKIKVNRNNITIGGSIAADTDRFYSRSASLKDGVTLNFKVEAGKTFDDRKDGAYVKFTGSSIEKKLKFDSAVKTADSDGRTFYTFSLPVRPDRMTEQITAGIYYGNGNKGDEVTVSVKQYLESLLYDENAEGNAKYQEIVYALLTYGARSQKYTGYRLNDLADPGEVFNGSSYLNLSNKYNPQISGNGTVKAKSATLELGGNTSVCVKFETPFSEGCSVECINTETMEHPETETSYEGRILTVRLKDVRPQDLDVMYEFKVTGQDDTASVTYSAFSYIKTMLEREDTPEMLKGLLRSLYDYNQAAEHITGERDDEKETGLTKVNISMGNSEGFPGDSVRLPFYMGGCSGITAEDLRLDSGIKLKMFTEFDENTVQCTEFDDGFMLVSNEGENLENNTLVGYIEFIIPENTEPGKYKLDYSYFQGCFYSASMRKQISFSRDDVKINQGILTVKRSSSGTGSGGSSGGNSTGTFYDSDYYSPVQIGQRVNISYIGDELDRPEVNARVYSKHAGDNLKLKAEISNGSRGWCTMIAELEINTNYFEILGSAESPEDAECYVTDSVIYRNDNVPSGTSVLRVFLQAKGGKNLSDGDYAEFSVPLKIKEYVRDGYYSIPFYTGDEEAYCNRRDDGRIGTVQVMYKGAVIKIGE